MVKPALQTISYALNKVQLFHSDRGKEFDNALIEDVITAFDIKRSLRQVGCPYDNAVSESTYRAFKIEFVYQEQFSTLEELAIKTRD